jgi:hypothetical protein
MGTNHDIAPEVAAAGDLIGLALEGAAANARPDLIRRLTAARDGLAGASSSSPPVRTAATTVLQSLESLEVDLRARRAILTDQSRTGRVYAERNHAHELLSRFQTRAGTWGQLFAESFADVSSDLEFRLLSGARTVVVDAERALTAPDGPKNAEDLDRWLDQRLTVETAAVHRLVHDGARTVARTLSDHLELPAAPPLPAPPVTTATELVAALPVPPPVATAHRRGAIRMLTVVMPTYGGLMMGVILPRVIGLVLPGLMFLAISVAGALTMGGAALAVERQQQRETGRNQLRITVRTAADNWHHAAGKQARDALRAVQGDVRDAIATAAADRGERLTGQYAAAQAAAEASADAATALSSIAEDLQWIGELRRKARDLFLLSAPRLSAPREHQPARQRRLNIVS